MCWPVASSWVLDARMPTQFSRKQASRIMPKFPARRMAQVALFMALAFGVGVSGEQLDFALSP
jgi:hypothetical protein